MDMEVGASSRGIFGTTASGGRAFNGRRFRRKTASGALDRFAEELSKHDLTTGDLGGDVRESATRCGCKSTQGAAMLQRIRKRLGWQAV
jgi:hypothetical protein